MTMAIDTIQFKHLYLRNLNDGYIIKLIDGEELNNHILSLIDFKGFSDNEKMLSMQVGNYSVGGITGIRNNEFLKKFKQTIVEYYTKTDLRIDDIAKKLNRCKKTVQNKIKSAIGISPMQYLWGYRLERAMELLLQTDISIGQVSDEVGFRSLQHFSSSFKLYTGQSPTGFRDKHNRNVNQLS